MEPVILFREDRDNVRELNDGQMSGLSCTDPVELYRRMADVLRHKTKDEDDDWGHIGNSG